MLVSDILVVFLILCKILVAKTITQLVIVNVYVGMKKMTPTSNNIPTKTSIIENTITKTSIYTKYVKLTSETDTTSSSYYDEINNYKGPYVLNKTFAIQMTDNHNYKRSLHGAQMLHWNSTVFEYAANYALEYNCSGILQHSGGKYGENLAIGYTTNGSVDAWYAEGDDYPYGTESIYDHFTALVWNNSFSLGCAYKYCNSVWGTYIICSYYPAGNVIGESVQNVFPVI